VLFRTQVISETSDLPVKEKSHLSLTLVTVV